MKKTLKITGIALMIFALITNLHSAIFTFYGIKNNQLDGAIWATALASGGESSGSSSGAGSNSSGSWYDSPVNGIVHCERMYYVGNSSNNSSGSVSYTTNAAGVVSATVSYSSSSGVNYTGSIAPHDAYMRQCIGPDWAICTTIEATEACK